ncbi:MAG: hypothetical protein KDD69_05380 [Bdellovibrionales bacterium]|nr:hypothetical protein [Bdellovibrionales bacterium]
MRRRNNSSLQHPFFVLTGLSGSSSLGELRQDATGHPMFLCVESQPFLERRPHREAVADELFRIGHSLPLKPLTYYVVVHKADDEFVAAQLGLADELMKKGVHVELVATPAEGVRQAIERCIATRREALPCEVWDVFPLLEQYDSKYVCELGQLLAQLQQRRKNGLPTDASDLFGAGGVTGVSA